MSLTAMTSQHPVLPPAHPEKFGTFPLFERKDATAPLPTRVLLPGPEFPPRWPVWTQPDNISCTAFAAAGLMMYRQHRKRLGPDAAFDVTSPWDEGRAPSPWYLAYMEKVVCNEVGHLVGVYPHAAVGALMRYGACPQSHWPTSPACFHDQAQFAGIAAHPEQVEIAREAALPSLPVQPRSLDAASGTQRDLDLLRACLAAGQAFLFAAVAYPSVPPQRALGDIGEPDLSGRAPSGSHCVLCIGYDDDFVSPEGIHLGARFLIRNSEGPGRGWSGYQSMAPAWLADTNVTYGLFTVEPA